jgi:alpha-aminoadipic semialdehyde synthase
MKTLLIRAEDKNPWERRTALSPSDLENLIQNTGVPAFVERSEKRVFPVDNYVAAGAKICNGMEAGDVILGVKEIPAEKILDSKVYVYFSHVIKGQSNNMPMLRRIIDSGSTLIDYEKITDESGRRLVYFGSFAGDAGALDILWLTGQYWRSKGIQTPLTECRQANQYHSLQEAREALQEIGKQIRASGIPNEIGPVVIGVLGYGNVSKGAQQIFECLPVERITPAELLKINQPGHYKTDRIYLTVFKEENLVIHKAGKEFELNDYYQRPENYTSQFEQYLPYLSILVNAIYWEKRYPRFVTWDALQTLHKSTPHPKLCAIADISCDVNGAVECTVKCTDSGMPAFQIDPATRKATDGHTGEGIVVLAIDNLPCELSRDASQFFSRQLAPFLPGILKADYSKSFEESGLAPELRKAVIVYNGQLTSDYQYLEKYLK